MAQALLSPMYVVAMTTKAGYILVCQPHMADSIVMLGHYSSED